MSDPSSVRRIARGCRRAMSTGRLWVLPVAPLGSVTRAIAAYPRYIHDYARYRWLVGRREASFLNSYPCLTDRSPRTPFDPHYLYQAIWASERIDANVEKHVDVGSDVLFVGMLATRIPVTFVDIRPLDVSVAGLTSVAGSITELPLTDRSVPSLSCLHVVEHVGLGRYGESLDPLGTQKACAELARVLAPGGTLLVSTPIGRPRTVFNAHRIHAPARIRDFFRELDLVEFSYVDDGGSLRLDAPLDVAARLQYGCGLFRFTRTGAGL